MDRTTIGDGAWKIATAAAAAEGAKLAYSLRGTECNIMVAGGIIPAGGRT